MFDCDVQGKVEHHVYHNPFLTYVYDYMPMFNCYFVPWWREGKWHRRMVSYGTDFVLNVDRLNWWIKIRWELHWRSNIPSSVALLSCLQLVCLVHNFKGITFFFNVSCANTHPHARKHARTQAHTRTHIALPTPPHTHRAVCTHWHTYSLSLSLSLSDSLSLSHTYTHIVTYRPHARMYARTHTHTHIRARARAHTKSA